MITVVLWNCLVGCAIVRTSPCQPAYFSLAECVAFGLGVSLFNFMFILFIWFSRRRPTFWYSALLPEHLNELRLLRFDSIWFSNALSFCPIKTNLEASHSDQQDCKNQNTRKLLLVAFALNRLIVRSVYVFDESTMGKCLAFHASMEICGWHIRRL